MQTKGCDFGILPGFSSPVNLSIIDLKILCLTIKKGVGYQSMQHPGHFTGEVGFQLPTQFGSFGKSVADMHCRIASI